MATVMMMNKAESESLSSYNSEVDEKHVRHIDNEHPRLHPQKASRPQACFRPNLSIICWGIVLCIASLTVGFLVGVTFSDRLGQEEVLSSNLSQRLESLKECGGWTVDPNHAAICSVCSEAVLVRVEGAEYADCDGLYGLSNLTVATRKGGKQNENFVLVRMSGGWGRDARHLYWGRQGWVLGSLGQFRGQQQSYYTQEDSVEQGAPWSVTWAGSVTVQLSRCGAHRPGSPKKPLTLNALPNDESDTNIVKNKS